MKLKTLIYGLIFLILAGCSASKVTKQEKEGKSDVETGSDQKEISNRDKKIAKEYFINGSMADLKSQYEVAISEYQKALKIDPNAGIHFALAKDFYKLNKLAPALTHSRSAVQLNSSNVDYKFLLANIYNSSNKPDSAAVVYENIIEMDSTNARAYFNLGQVYERTNKPQQALEIYKKLIDIIGPEWNVLIKIADINERLGNIEGTIKTVESLLELNPSNLDLQKILIESYVKTQKYDKAIELADDALKTFPDDLTLIEFKANALVSKGEVKKGSEEYFKLIESSEISFDDKLRIASAFLPRSDSDTVSSEIAKKMLTEINKDTLDWQVNAYLGEIESQENNDSAAIKYYKTSANLAEWNLNVWKRLGALLYQTQRYAEAVDEMKKAVVKFPNDFAVNLILGLSYSIENNNKEAAKYLKVAVQINPGDYNALSAYGFTLNQLNKEDEALIYLNRALDINPNDVQTLGMIGLIYDNKKMYDECDSIYEKAMSIDSTNALVLNNYAFSLSERGIQLERALNMAKKALAQDSTSSSYLDTIGWIYYKLGKIEKAETYIRKSLDEDSSSAEVFDHLGDVYNQLNKRGKAEEMWNKALELEPDNQEIKTKLQKGTL